MAENYLKRARQLFKRKKYSHVISMLEVQVFRYRENYGFYYLLGVSCLETNDIGGALSYLKRSLSLKPLNVDSLLGLAVVHLRREETQEAIRNWFSVLDFDPDNKIAKRGLKYVKNPKIDYSENFYDIKKLRKLLPVKQFSIHPVIYIIVSGMLLISLLGIVISNTAGKLDVKRSIGIDLTIPDLESYIENPDGAFYIVTEKEAQEVYKLGSRLFSQGKDNRARPFLNKLLFSNASIKLKELAKIMIDYSRVPDFTTIDTTFEYEKIKADPLLYNGCYVQWRGMNSNLIQDGNKIAFDFLVGYDTKENLKGVVRSKVGSLNEIPNPGDSCEILAMVAADPESMDFELYVISYRKLFFGSK